MVEQSCVTVVWDDVVLCVITNPDDTQQHDADATIAGPVNASRSHVILVQDIQTWS